MSTSRADDFTHGAARDHFSPMRTARMRHLLGWCLASAHFEELDGPRCFAHSRSDYATTVLGTTPARLRRWIRVGLLLRQSEVLRQAFLDGVLPLSAWDELALVRRPAPWVERALPRCAGPGIRRLREVLSHLTQSDEQIRAGADDACIEAIVAEASTDLGPVPPREHARRRHAALVRPVDTERVAHHPRGCTDRSVRIATSDGAPEGALAPGGSERAARSPRPRADRRWRRACVTLHRRLLRQLERLRHHDATRDETILQLLLDGAHTRWGFHRFGDFVQVALDLPSSTAFDHIHRARRARAEHPLAVAWAAHQSSGDHRAWSVAGHPPPSDDQLRTSTPSLESLVHGGTPSPDQIRGWESRGAMGAWVERTWLLPGDLADLIVQQIELLDGRRPWLALCRLCALARSSWARHVELQNLPTHRRRTLERDGWCCRAPGCQKRDNLQVHHLEYRAHGGPDALSNLVVLFAFHHLQGEHGGNLRVRGRVGENGKGVTWEMGFDERGRALRVYEDDQLVYDPVTGIDERQREPAAA